MTGRLRLIVTPGVFLEIRIMLCCRYLSGESGSVLPITMKILQRSRAAPEIHHLRPLSTYSSPSRLIVSWMLVAAELATSGSVMAKAERISPLSQCVTHPFFFHGLSH